MRAEGPKGKLAQPLPTGMTRHARRQGPHHRPRRRQPDRARAPRPHALAVANMVFGVKDGFERKLEIVGIGYRAQMQGKNIQLALGYSHPVIFPLPEGITAEIEKQVSVTLRAPTRRCSGETAAKLRSLRKPDPYKGKGIKYADESSAARSARRQGRIMITRDRRRARATSATSGCAGACAARRRGRGWRCSAPSTTSTRSSSTTTPGRTRARRGQPQQGVPRAAPVRRQRRRREGRRRAARPEGEGAGVGRSSSTAAATSTTDASKRSPTPRAPAASCSR